MEKKDSWNPLIVSIIGSIIGGLFVYLLLKDRLKTQTLQTTTPQVDLSLIEQRLSRIELRLEQPKQIEQPLQTIPQIQPEKVQS